MKVEVLSHACMLITDNDSSIITDPWLLGSAYWRSWWNYPKAVFDEEKISSVDAVVISHIHWDHWHGATLKKYFLDKQFIIPDEPGMRSEDDLRSIGINKIARLRNRETFEVKSLKVRLYQFGLYLNDSAVIIESDNSKIMNANDAKIAGASLTSLLKQEGTIDLAFRSHSTANARACQRIRGSNQTFDDNEHYLRSFKFFMDKVKPKHAIPFASNHCHLHEDVMKFNGIISNPFVLDKFLNNLDKEWRFEVMLPGSAWDDRAGFSHRHGSEAFLNLNQKLSAYQSEVNFLLERQKLKEDKVKVDQRLIQKFLQLLPKAKRVPRKYQRPVFFRLTYPSLPAVFYELNCGTGAYEFKQTTRPDTVTGPEIVMPALIFRDAVLKNMFHHAAISKRCEYLGDNISDLRVVAYWQSQLEKRELIGRAGMDKKYLYRTAVRYLKRLPELRVYVKAFLLLKVLRRPIYHVEELILREKWADKKMSGVSISDR